MLSDYGNEEAPRRVVRVVAFRLRDRDLAAKSEASTKRRHTWIRWKRDSFAFLKPGFLRRQNKETGQRLIARACCWLRGSDSSRRACGDELEPVDPISCWLKNACCWELSYRYWAHRIGLRLGDTAGTAGSVPEANPGAGDLPVADGGGISPESHRGVNGDFGSNIVSLDV